MNGEGGCTESAYMYGGRGADTFDSDNIHDYWVCSFGSTIAPDFVYGDLDYDTAKIDERDYIYDTEGVTIVPDPPRN